MSRPALRSLLSSSSSFGSLRLAMRGGQSGVRPFASSLSSEAGKEAAILQQVEERLAQMQAQINKLPNDKRIAEVESRIKWLPCQLISFLFGGYIAHKFKIFDYLVSKIKRGHTGGDD